MKRLNSLNLCFSIRSPFLQLMLQAYRGLQTKNSRFFFSKENPKKRPDKNSGETNIHCGRHRLCPLKKRRVTWRIRQDFGSVVSSFAKSLAV